MFPSKSAALTAGLIAMAATQGASAQSNSAAEVRGFDACVAAAEAEGLKGISTRRTYFLRKTDERNVFYVNVLAWEGSERVSKGIRCETSSGGFKLHSTELADGHYDADERSVLKLAGTPSGASAKTISTAGR